MGSVPFTAEQFFGVFAAYNEAVPLFGIWAMIRLKGIRSAPPATGH